MLINPNLLDITKTTQTYAPYNFNTKIARVVDNYVASRVQFKLPDNLVVGQEYTFSCEIDNIDGDKELNVWVYPGPEILGRLKADNGRQAYTFKLDSKNTHIYLYLGIIGKTNGSYKIYNIKLEEGTEDTTYVPYKDNLPKDKQALLPPQGHYKEIQAL